MTPSTQTRAAASEPASESVQAQRDHWKAEAQQAWQAAAELRHTQSDLTRALQGMVGLVDLLCARPDVSPEFNKVTQENHRVVTARAVLEKVRG